MSSKYLYYRLTSVRFNSFYQICSLIQDFIFISKYNLKRTNISNRNVLIYVCSCISKKKTQQKSLSNTITNNRVQLIENIEYNNTQHERLIKRDNIHACYFRIKFKRDKKGNDFMLANNCNLLHNHPPVKSKDKDVSKTYIKFITI